MVLVPAYVEVQAEALRLRLAGNTYPEIAKLQGCALSSAHDRVQKALRDTLREPADQLREMDLGRLDAMLAALWPTAIGDDGEPPNPRSVDRVLNILKQRADLLGLNAPNRSQVQVLSMDLVASEIDRLETLLEVQSEPDALELAAGESP